MSPHQVNDKHAFTAMKRLRQPFDGTGDQNAPALRTLDRGQFDFIEHRAMMGRETVQYFSNVALKLALGQALIQIATPL